MPYKERARDFRGYTLIELLIVVVTMALLFGLGVPNYRSFTRQKQLEAVAEKIRADLRLVQGKALAGEKRGCASLDGYQFDWVSSTSYRIGALCLDGTSDWERTVSDIFGTVTMTRPSPDPIIFKVLGKGVSTTSDISIVLNQENTGQSVSVVVTPAGEIK